MQTVRLNKNDLIEKVSANRDQHRTEFEAAFNGFRKAMRKKLEHNLDLLEKGETPPIYLDLVVPQDHTDDYDQVLLMLEMSVDAEIELQHREFRQYVMDEWGWKDEHNTTSAFYSSR